LDDPNYLPFRAPQTAPTADEVREAIVLGEAPPPAYALPPPPSPQRRMLLPLALFLATCLSTFWTGAVQFDPENFPGQPPDAPQFYRAAWENGLIYMACVMGILLTHEMGHFLQTVRHRIVSSWPVFIPLPFSPIGTMGAVIFMQGMKADRRQMFDIGISGPLAGLLVAIPVTCIGILQSPAVPITGMGETYHDPLLVQWLIAWLKPDLPADHDLLLNPFTMAGWVGMLITGLNMLPISQLDGGHVIYALFGRKAHLIARAFLVLAILFVVFANAAIWTPMLILVILIGTDHPPTADDRMTLGPLRWAIGLAALAIPVLCFPPHGITSAGVMP
jgi:membrane-associated protease RseP (regulator of RpoE activity)